jgi:cyclopropane-fatty-acyl-phospholipid synthase
VTSTPVAETLRPLMAAVFGENLPLALEAWDGSRLGPADAPATIVVRSPRALRRLLYAPNELGLGRAYVAGDLDLEGDVFAALGSRELIGERDEHVELRLGRGRALRAALRLGALGPPPAPPPEEARLRGSRHSKARDAAAVQHHYDVSNDFYRLVLGSTMTYSCAYFERADGDLDDAQCAKYDLVCRKLGLGPGMRLLDVGCGWGGMLMHAAEHYGVEAVGVTLSTRQHELAQERIADRGLSGRVQVRVQDYRDLSDGPYDAISSIGMFEHVGLERLSEYFGVLHGLLRERGRLLNHGISRPPGPAAIDPHSFIGRYVFPDGELHEIGSVVSAMQQQAFEVRDVHSLREHYALTLRAWVANLETHWDRAVELVGAGRARVWRLYMAGSALNFEAARTSIHQILGVKLGARGESDMPLRREGFDRDDRRSTALA